MDFDEASVPPSPGGDCAVLMSSLQHLDGDRFAILRRAVAFDLRLQRHRLAALLLSPPEHFSHALSRVRSLSLSEKTALLGRLLLGTLFHFARAANPHALVPAGRTAAALAVSSRDLDAAVLLMAMCDSYDDHNDDDSSHDPLPDEAWRAKISAHLLQAEMSVAALGGEAAFVASMDAAVKCRRLLAAVTGERGEKEGSATGAAAAAIAALGSERVPGDSSGSWWCAVCRDEMKAGEEICAMPCSHRFHWRCILPWLRRRNTCPCCRFELPADDVFCEIGRLWRVVADAAASGRRRPRCECGVALVAGQLGA